MSRPAIVFDLDGTLVDLPIAIDRLRAEVTAIVNAAGHPGEARPILAAIEAIEGAGQGDAAARARQLIEDAEVAAARIASPTRGAARALELCRAAGVRLGLVTNNSRACVAPALARLGASEADFEIVVSRDDVARPKPEPEGLVRVARTLGGPFAFIGDGTADVGAAAAAGALVDGELFVVAIPGRSSASALEAAGACVLCDDALAATRCALDWATRAPPRC